jgi:hypothetical protein
MFSFRFVPCLLIIKTLGYEGAPLRKLREAHDALQAAEARDASVVELQTLQAAVADKQSKYDGARYGEYCDTNT